ncbi:hypothetical protein HHI36_021230 [Cryptolaemus montrouzieri]|uniref:Uncharacterized protein n=1 Tax=Cryptolaemus montrouzieri TaxID=559131 RepID=A0ABD2MX75_9CUCU
MAVDVLVEDIRRISSYRDDHQASVEKQTRKQEDDVEHLVSLSIRWQHLREDLAGILGQNAQFRDCLQMMQDK